MVPGVGFEPTRLAAVDFKSTASAVPPPRLRFDSAVLRLVLHAKCSHTRSQGSEIMASSACAAAPPTGNWSTVTVNHTLWERSRRRPEYSSKRTLAGEHATLWPPAAIYRVQRARSMTLSPVVRAASACREWSRSMLATGCPHHAARFECAGCVPPEGVSVEATPRRETASPTSLCSECEHRRYAHTNGGACHARGCACERFRSEAAHRDARPQTRSEDMQRSSSNPPMVLL